MGPLDAEFGERIAHAVASEWGFPVGSARRLHGGQESVVYRVGDHVVRVGPSWRTVADLNWSGSVASAAARHVPQAIAPVPTPDARTVIEVEGRPVTVWPFIPGHRGDDLDARQRGQAAGLLARLHRALAQLEPGPPPARAVPAVPVPDLADEQLDAWLAGFRRAHRPRQPVHGDFYAGNVIVDRGRIVAVLDWDEARIAAPEWELAGAAWEWGAGRDTLDLTEAGRFVDRYLAEGGTAPAIDETALRQLIRERIRREVAYDRATTPADAGPDPEDAAYRHRQVEAFRALRPRTAIRRAH